MKKIKCFVSIIVSLVLIFTTVMTSFGADANLDASGSSQITMQDTEGNTAEKEYFYGYMLMSASVAEAGSKIEKAAYKVNPKYKSILIDVVKDLSGEYSDVDPTDEQIIDYISKLTSDDAATGIRAFADKVYLKIFEENLGVQPLTKYEADATSESGVFSDVAQGYWLIVGKTENNPNSHNNTLVMLDTAGKTAITVQVKPIDVPVVEKEVQDNETDGSDDEWGDKADYQVGELVPFRLTAHPQDSENKDKSYEDFTIYKLIFTDTLSSGLRYYGSDKDSDSDPTKQLKVYAVKEDGTRTLIKNTTAETTDAEKKKGYTIDYQAGTQVLTIDFSDLKSIVAAEGEAPINVDPTYSIVVEYYAELLPSAVTTVKETNKVKISYSNDPMHDHTADSEEVTVDVYTYGLVIDKKENGGDVQKYLEGAEFKLYKVGADGNKGDEIKDGIKIQYYTVNSGVEGGNTLNGGAITDNTDKKAVRFTFEGLDEGTYILEESTVPEGYNGIPDIKFTITPTTDDVSGDINGATASVAGDSEGKAEFSDDISKFYPHTTIINNTGLELPSTGGEGRKALLLFGVIFAVGAGVVLATNKRMKKIYR